MPESPNGAVTVRPAAEAPRGPGGARSSNLPAPLTRLVGLRTTVLIGGLGVVLAFLVVLLSSVPSVRQLPEHSL